MANLEKKDLDILIERIKDGDCVLFLGPDLFLDNNKSSIYSAFSKMKSEEMKKAGIRYDEGQADNIYYTVNRYIKGISELQKQESKIESTSGIKEKKLFIGLLEKSMRENDTYRKLAQLPFYLTINTNPDDQIYQLQRSNPGNRKYFFWYYDFTKENNELLAVKELPDDINPDNFVVYNVYGHASIDRVRSLIVGESEFVNFARKVNLPGNGMPESIKNFIKNDKVCLFLGFKYDSWPLKILLQALGFSSEIPKQNISFVYSGLPKYQSDFYSDEMKFLFIDGNTEHFIDEMFLRFNESSSSPTLTIQPSEPLKVVFVSKVFPETEGQKEDIRIREKISAQLKPLQRKGYISLWSEDLKIASDNESELLNEKYESADIFILLGSDELNTDEVYPKMKRAIDLVHTDPDKKIVPVYIRDFIYELIEGIDEQNWIPKVDNKAVPVIDNEGNEDKRCTEVCEILRKLIQEILSKRANG